MQINFAGDLGRRMPEKPYTEHIPNLTAVQRRECYSCPCCAFLKAAAASSLRPSFWYARPSRKYA
jgi:hypothetical protein